MGVWIETDIMGLHGLTNKVTPCMGVWIETVFDNNGEFRWSSHPVWVCGLKPDSRYLQFLSDQSHPVWVCGLKQG